MYRRTLQSPPKAKIRERKRSEEYEDLQIRAPEEPLRKQRRETAASSVVVDTSGQEATSGVAEIDSI
jgi:hypothetical protein